MLSSLLLGREGPLDFQVIVSPDEVLFEVPFGSLPDQEQRSLLDSHELVVTPSLRLWSALAELPERPPRCALLIAGAHDGGALFPNLGVLPALDRELDSVSDLYGCSVRLRAASALLSADWTRYGVVHYAGHTVAGGVSNGALLMGDGSSLQLIDAPAIERLSLAGSVVVLSSCTSGGGRPSITSGRDGIARAFLSAGARSVIASLWPVDDRPAIALSRALHRRLASGRLRRPHCGRRRSS